MRLEQVLILSVQGDIAISSDAFAEDRKEVRVVELDIGKQAEREMLLRMPVSINAIAP
jgi:hypothetical protein